MKKGQVTAFIIVGIVILIVLFLIFYLKGGIKVKTRFLMDDKDAINKLVEDCIDEEARRALDIIGKQGGSLVPLKYRLYNGNNVAYLCYNIIDDERCMNRVLRLEDIERELNRYLEGRLNQCINLEGFNVVSRGKLIVKSTIARDNVLVVVDYPIVFEKKDKRISIDRFSKSINIALGKLFDTSLDILNDEASYGDFDQLPYMIVHKDIRIEKDRPYPDKAYILTDKNSNYMFQFLVEGGE